MKKILIPVDFSKPSEHALEVGAKIAKLLNAEITVVHMLGLSEAILTKNETQEFEEAQYYMQLAKKRFRDFLDKPYLKGLKVDQIVQNYKIFKELNNVARERRIDLIVMGSHGVSGVNEFFVGSNTEKVVRSAEVPVLVIKKSEPKFKIKKILFACDFTDEMVLSFKRVKDFAMQFSAKMELIYVNTPYDNYLTTPEIEERVSTFLYKAGEPDQNVIIYNDFSVEKGMIAYGEKEKFDVLSIPTHGRKRISHILLGSIGEDLANHANLPVLTVKI